MKITFTLGALCALCAACLTAVADDGPFASGSMLPIPDSDYRYPGFGNGTPVAPVSNEVSAGEVVPVADEFDYHATSLESTVEATLSGATQSHKKNTGASQKDCTSCGKGKASCDCGKTSHRRRHLGIGRDWFSPVHGVAGAKTGTGWYAYGGGLSMTRAKCDRTYFTQDGADPWVGLLDARDISMNWSGGFEVRVGKYFNCGQNAVEVVYWGLFPSDEEATIRNTDVVGNLESRLNFDALEAFNPDTGLVEQVSNWVDGADTHRIRADYSIHNLEVNLMNYSGCVGYGACRPRFHFNWGIGFRYFKLDEDFQFSAKETLTGYDYDDSADQIDYISEVENNLLGLQVGGTGRYYINNCWSLMVGAKVGVYNNRINHNQCVHIGGDVVQVIGGPHAGENYDVESSKDDVAFLGELNIGLNYQISCCWSISAGYRMLGAAGIATATGQIPWSMDDKTDAALINSWDSLFLHGGYAGVEFNY